MKISAKKLSCPLSNIMDIDKFALLSVSPVFRYADGKRTDEQVGTRYTIANPKTFENFDVKVPIITPVVSQEEIDKNEERYWITFTNPIVVPYEISFGKATCSVTAESVKLVDLDVSDSFELDD